MVDAQVADGVAEGLGVGEGTKMAEVAESAVCEPNLLQVTSRTHVPIE